MQNKAGSFHPALAAANRPHWLPGLLLATATGTAQAVAGGAGGGFDGGDDAIGIIIEIIFWIILELPFPYNLIGLAIFVAVFWFFGRKVRAVSGLNQIRSIPQATAKTCTIPTGFLKRNPGFDQATLLAKINVAFPAIQQAWMTQDMAPVRRWISDGVWQRFNTQFTMMRLLGQTNLISQLQIRKVFIDAFEEDGNFDIVHAGIHYRCNDDFVSDKFPDLDQRGALERLEYWTFIRKSGVAEKDLYHSDHCPSCGADLPADLGEIARCPNCQATSTLGDYDWILSEITQADDYANQSNKLDKSGRLTQRIRTALGDDAGFSVQLIEDKASNAYLQIIAAQATGQPEAMRRFVGDTLFERLSHRTDNERPYVFNRLYLNNVTLIDHYRTDGKDNLAVAFKRTAQRIDITSDALRLIDQGPYATNEIMILSRDVGAGLPKGALYAHTCPACGAPVGDTLDIKCGYCGAVLNSTRHEWIVSALLKPDEYASLGATQRPAMATNVAVKQLDPLFSARDYALNNVMMILGIDGQLTPDELCFAQDLARKLGYDLKKLTGMFDLAINRKLVLRLPEDRKSADRVLKLMEAATFADNKTTAPEQALLDEVRERIGTMTE